MPNVLIPAFILIVADALFIGQALSDGYSPFAALAASLCFGLALFAPILGEYVRLESGMNKMHRHFKSLMKDQDVAEAEVEIIVPGARQRKANTYDLDRKKDRRPVILALLVIGGLLFTYDAVTFYIIEEGLKSDSGPISNF